nr:hypothetical protein [Enterocloster citroniae]
MDPSKTGTAIQIPIIVFLLIHGSSSGQITFLNIIYAKTNNKPVIKCIRLPVPNDSREYKIYMISGSLASFFPGIAARKMYNATGAIYPISRIRAGILLEYER